MSLINSISKIGHENKKKLKIIISPLFLLICFLDLIWPKDENLIIVGSSKGQYKCGSPHIFYNYIKENVQEFEVDYYLPFNHNKNVLDFITYILKCMPRFLKAKTLISSHPPNDFFPFKWSSRKNFINTWHGIPLKSMFFADNNRDRPNLNEIKKLGDT